MCWHLIWYTWFGILGVKNRNKPFRIVKMGSKIVGKRQRQLADMYIIHLRRKAEHIVSDPVHPLFTEFRKMPSRRRYRAAIATKTSKKKVIHTKCNIIIITHNSPCKKLLSFPWYLGCDTVIFCWFMGDCVICCCTYFLFTVYLLCLWFVNPPLESKINFHFCGQKINKAKNHGHHIRTAKG